MSKMCSFKNTGCIKNVPNKIRAVARALIGGGVYIHIFVLCPTNFF